MSRALSAICSVLEWANQSLVDLSDAIRSAESEPQVDVFDALREQIRHEKARADAAEIESDTLQSKLEACESEASSVEAELALAEARIAELGSAVRHEQLAFAEAQDAAGRTIAERDLDIVRLNTRIGLLKEQIEQMRDAHGPLCEDLGKAADRIAALEQQLARAWKPWPPEGPEREVVMLTRLGREQRVSYPTCEEFHPAFRYAYRELTAEEKERANG